MGYLIFANTGVGHATSTTPPTMVLPTLESECTESYLTLITNFTDSLLFVMKDGMTLMLTCLAITLVIFLN